MFILVNRMNTLQNEFRELLLLTCSKTEDMCVDERETGVRVRLQGAEVVKVQEFKYLGTTVQSSGDCGREVKNRVGRMEQLEKSVSSDL